MAASEEKIEELEEKVMSNYQEVQNTVTEVKSLQSAVKTIETLLVGMRGDMGSILEVLADKSVGGGMDVKTPSLTPAPMKREDSSGLAWRASTDILQKHLNERNLKEAEEIETLKTNVHELQKETNTKAEDIMKLQSECTKWKHTAELLMQERDEKNVTVTSKVVVDSGFPSNETVIHNLLMAQIEFYFSDHHLKRDKPLMTKLTGGPHRGFISFEEVTKFPKVRTLGQDNIVIQKAILKSKYLHTKSDESDNLAFVGRDKFETPRAQEFPFRRTVFVYGIHPKNNTEKWIREQFDCFGTIMKVKFDAGPHSMPRKVGHRLLKKEPSRVTRLHIHDFQHSEFEFRKSVPQASFNAMDTYSCHKCKRLKEYKDGYYASTNSRSANQRFCIQCAAKTAEDNLTQYQEKFKDFHVNQRQIKDLYGINEHNLNDPDNFVTCLIVYESQRQASKCVYVRSRLGINGCFATHFHNFTRNKKEISSGDSGEIIEGPSAMQRESSTHRLVPARMTHTSTGQRHARFAPPPKMTKTTSAASYLWQNKI